jgi:adenylate cyclase
MPQSRQLASVMFTDIVGYTTLMGDDESNALDVLIKSRQLQQPIIEQLNGRWIKEMGDGVLASFSTAIDAVSAAIKIQEKCRKDENFQLRIGIHLGDVIFDNQDVFGDGVNIASRIQSIAKPGSIYVSESVNQIISNKKDIVSRFVRVEVLKNVKEAIRIYEVISSSPESSFQLPKNKETTAKKSIAVLPFVNMSNDPDQEYFSDGMAEEILNSLSHLKDLKVAGRTSSFQFKGRNIDLREVGEKLNVQTVLEGSVRKQSNRLRITAQLVNVEDGYHLWSEKYDRDMDDIFAIQDEIALSITEKLKLTLLDKERESIVKVSTRSTEAYELFLKGKFYINRRGSSILTGLNFAKQAVAIDPSYALAQAGLGYANLLTAVYSFSPGKALKTEMKVAAGTAIRLDDTLGEGYFTLAEYYTNFEWNWKEAKKNYLKSIELSPSYATSHSLYGMVQLGFVEGDFEGAEKHGHMAIKLEPLSAIDHADLAWTLHTAGRFEESLECAQIAMELDGNSFLAHRLTGLSYIALERYPEAIATLKYLNTMSNGHQHAVNSLIWAYCAAGNFTEAKSLMDELKKKAETEYIAGAYLGLSAAWMGDADAAMNYLERAFEDIDPILIHLKRTPSVPVALRKDQRFQDLMVRIGFPD